MMLMNHRKKVIGKQETSADMFWQQNFGCIIRLNNNAASAEIKEFAKVTGCLCKYLYINIVAVCLCRG